MLLSRRGAPRFTYAVHPPLTAACNQLLAALLLGSSAGCQDEETASHTEQETFLSSKTKTDL